VLIPLESVAEAVGTPAQAAPRPRSGGPPGHREPPDRAPAWYVRGPDGQQYGPAGDDVFEEWIAEGRIAADTWLWREDWTDWRLAGQAISERLPPQAPAAPLDQPSGPGPASPWSDHPAADASWPVADADDAPSDGFVIEVDRPERISRVRQTHGRRRLKPGTVWAVLGLSALAVALCGLLVWILMFRNQ
jgi:hypothetical protein